MPYFFDLVKGFQRFYGKIFQNIGVFLVICFVWGAFVWNPMKKRKRFENSRASENFESLENSSLWKRVQSGNVPEIKKSVLEFRFLISP